MGIKVTIKFIYYWPTALLGEESSSIYNILKNLILKVRSILFMSQSVFQISHDMMAKGCKFSVFHQILMDVHILFSPKILLIRPEYQRGAKDKKMLLASGCKLSKELMYPVPSV